VTPLLVACSIVLASVEVEAEVEVEIVFGVFLAQTVLSSGISHPT